MLWQEEKRSFPNNFNVALKISNMLEQRLKKDPGLRKRYRLAFSADIEARYHQVQVNSDDADALRFFWLEDVNSDDIPDTYQMLVHIFGGKDSSSCANYAVRRTAPGRGSKSHGAFTECVNRSLYMDDLLKSVETEEQAVSIIKQLIELIQVGGFNLTKFQSKKKEVIDYLPFQIVSQQ